MHELYHPGEHTVERPGVDRVSSLLDDKFTGINCFGTPKDGQCTVTIPLEAVIDERSSHGSRNQYALDLNCPE